MWHILCEATSLNPNIRCYVPSMTQKLVLKSNYLLRQRSNPQSYCPNLNIETKDLIVIRAWFSYKQQLPLLENTQVRYSYNNLIVCMLHLLPRAGLLMDKSLLLLPLKGVTPLIQVVKVCAEMLQFPGLNPADDTSVWQGRLWLRSFFLTVTELSWGPSWE